MKNIVILSTSLRRGSNSEILAREVQRGAEEAGNCVTFISLVGKRIGFCIGCLACQKTHRCVSNDDAAAIAEAVKQADAVVFATPVYYYEMSGQMKTLLDRMNPLFSTDYRFREISLVATAADGDESAMDGAVNGLGGWIECFLKARLSKVLRGVGLGGPSEAAKRPDMLHKAYEMGKAL